MKTSRKSRVLSLILSLVMVLSLPLVVVGQEASPEQNYSYDISAYEPIYTQNEKAVAKRSLMLIQEEVKVFSDDTRSITAVKTIHDFNGQEYTLIELSPTGYMIFDARSGLFVEQSDSAPSPYKNAKGTLLYGGPTYYYVEEDGNITHTFLDTRLDCEDKTVLSRNSQLIVNKLQNSSNIEILNYLKTGRLDTVSQIVPSSTVTIDYVSYPLYIFLLQDEYNMGYYSPQGSGGICGYVAANILLYYNQRRYPSKDIITSSAFYDSNGLKGPSFTGFLLGCGLSNGYGYATEPFSLSMIIQHYLDATGADGYVNYSYNGSWGINNEISNYDRPTIAFGLLEPPEGGSKINHAVVVYGKNSNGQFVAHYGWPGFYQVYISGVISGNTYFYVS